MDKNKVTLPLTKDEALVLFDFVSRFTNDEKLRIQDQAEERVLWNLCALLEKQLAEPLAADYASLLDKARRVLRGEEH